MIKEIALRKLASDEGVNPYGVGALGASVAGAGLGGFGKYLENKILNETEEVSKDLLLPYKKGYDDYKKAQALREDLIKNYLSNRRFGTTSTITFKDKYKGFDLDDFGKGAGEGASTVFAKKDLSRKAMLDLLKQQKTALRENKTAFANYIQSRDAIKGAAKNAAKTMSGPFKKAGLISALLGTGLGGKYLYDKLTD